MKSGQILAMQATAEALAVSVQANPNTQQVLLAQASAHSEQDTFYLHPLPEMVLDGYVDDWLGLPYTPDTVSVINGFSESSDPNTVGKMRLGVSGDYVYVFARFYDPARQYHNPTQHNTAHDFVTVYFSPSEDQYYALNVYTAAPGQVQVRANEQMGAPRGSENWLKGFWREVQDGFQLEMRLPLNALRNGYALQFHQSELVNVRNSALQSEKEVDWMRLVKQEPQLNDYLKAFSHEGIRLSLFEENGFLLAQHGELAKGNYRVDSRWQQLLGMILRALSTEKEGREYQAYLPSGQIDKNTLQALSSEPLWTQRGRYQVAQIAVPIFKPSPEERVEAGENTGQVMGWAVLEQSTISMNLLLDSATGRLMLYSIMVSLLAALVFIIYASWLSFRVKRLSRAANAMVDAQGKFKQSFPVSKNPDELGELSRTFATLSNRLRDYTQYLETLASKLSHELRTPLAVVKSSLENLQQQSLNQQSQIYTERAQEGAERLSGILNAMSAATRLEQSLESSEMEVVELNHLLHELLPVYQDLSPHRNIRLIEQSTEALPVKIAPELFVQAIDKLIENALDFCPPDGEIRLSSQRQRHQAVLQVANAGPALKPELQGQIFESLVSFRGDDNAEQHLGLGLYVVRTIVQFHKGQVRAFNDKRSGMVVFEMLLPLVERTGLSS